MAENLTFDTELAVIAQLGFPGHTPSLRRDQSGSPGRGTRVGGLAFGE